MTITKVIASLQNCACRFTADAIIRKNKNLRNKNPRKHA